MNAPDVTEVVNACDAGREGELIFRSVYELAGCQKPMKRLWISSMEDSAIREALQTCAPVRTMTDFGMLPLPCQGRLAGGDQCDKAFSVLYHRTLNIGRVMSPDAGAHCPARS